jgi:hypothetical protein
MKSSISLPLGKTNKTRKRVRISSQTQEKELSPEAKEFNRQNNFSKKERLYALDAIQNDQDFKQYLEERRKGTPVDEYRSKKLRTMKKRDKLMRDIRKTRRKSKSPISPKTITLQNTKKHRITPQLIFPNSTTPSSSSKKDIQRVRRYSFFSYPSSLFYSPSNNTTKTTKKRTREEEEKETRG